MSKKAFIIVRVKYIIEYYVFNFDYSIVDYTNDIDKAYLFKTRQDAIDFIYLRGLNDYKLRFATRSTMVSTKRYKSKFTINY